MYSYVQRLNGKASIYLLSCELRATVGAGTKKLKFHRNYSENKNFKLSCNVVSKKSKMTTFFDILKQITCRTEISKIKIRKGFFKT